MVLLCKQKALYVKCCIIANGITDSQGDTLYAEDIKKIFTSFNNQDNFEIYHNGIPIEEVSLLENYISTADETLGTAIVPKGSWMAVVRVDNPDIKNGLLTDEFGGVSLNNRIAPRCKGNLTGIVRYKDVADAECVIPLLISFVEGGANGYGLHVMDYDAYIKKSKDVKVNENGGRKMDFKQFLNGLKSLIKEAEDTPEEEVPAVEKEDKAKEDEPVETPTEEVPVEEETEEEKEEDEPAVKKEEESTAEEEEEPAIEKEDETAETASEEDEPVVVEKSEEDESTDDFEAKVAAIVEKVLAEKLGDKKEDEADKVEEPAEEPVDEDTPKITKSEKVIVEVDNVPKQSNYFEISGRDPLTGKKIRK